MQNFFDNISQLSGLNVGCFYAVGTLLNRMIIEHYPVSSARLVCTRIDIRHALGLHNSVSSVLISNNVYDPETLVTLHIV